MNIMIVEDEDNIRTGLNELIDWRREGFEPPVLFAGALEALQYLEKKTVDVVLTDICMPILDGLEFAGMIREQQILCDIIILTGHNQFEFAQKAVELGVKRYLLKPISAERLKAVLGEVRAERGERIKLWDWIEIAKKRLEEVMPVIKNQFWNDLLGGRITDSGQLSERSRKAEIQIPKGEFSCIAIRRLNKTEVPDSLTLEVALQQIVDEILKEKLIYLMAYDGDVLVILSGQTRIDKLEILKESIVENLAITVGFGVSSADDNLLNTVRLAAEASEAVKSISDSKDEYYLYYRDISGSKDIFLSIHMQQKNQS